jgi:hypothetical protein
MGLLYPRLGITDICFLVLRGDGQPAPYPSLAVRARNGRVADKQGSDKERFGGTNPSCSLVLRPPASHIEPIGGSNSTVPEARILYRALLVAKIRIDQPIALGITLRPLEVVEKFPGMEGANPNSIGDPTS